MGYTAFLVAIFLLQGIPLKPTDEFEIKLDYDFRPRPLSPYNTVRLEELSGERTRGSGSSVLPYLILYIKPLRLKEEKMRVRITTGNGDKIFQKRVSVDSSLELDLGFTDDIKDRVTPHQYILTFIDSDKKPVDKIVISIGEDGSFLVNGEKRGSF